ncbi:hypothetical protein NP006_23480, partial [Salmonella enterica]|nr:hypothetical protein [Salmonella enterica]
SIDENFRVGEETHIPSTGQEIAVGNTNTNTSHLTSHRNEELTYLEDDFQYPHTTVMEIFDSTWSDEEDHHLRISEELQCNTNVQEFLADDMEFEENEFPSEQYSDLEEEFTIADDPYILNSRLLERPIGEATDEDEFYVGQIFASRQEFKNALVKHAMGKAMRYKPVVTRRKS